jgi:hypothetical protein
MKKTGKKNGRPSIYTEELAKRICDTIASDCDGLEAVCKKHDWMPDADTIYDWRHKRDGFSEAYLIARESQAHMLAEQCKDIAEETHKYVYYSAKTGAASIDSGIVAMQNMRLKAHSKLAAWFKPKYYNNKSWEDVVKESLEDKASIKELRAQLDAAAKKDY